MSVLGATMNESHQNGEGCRSRAFLGLLILQVWYPIYFLGFILMWWHQPSVIHISHFLNIQKLIIQMCLSWLWCMSLPIQRYLHFCIVKICIKGNANGRSIIISHFVLDLTSHLSRWVFCVLGVSVVLS